MFMFRIRRTVGPVAWLLSFVLTFVIGTSLARAAQASSKPAAKAKVQENTNDSVKKSVTKRVGDTLASSEELSGTIGYVSPSAKELTLMGANGIPYDFDLTAMSRIEQSGSKIARSELTDQSHKQATIKFVPTKRGNLAERVEITG